MTATTKPDKLPVKHIGVPSALCNDRIYAYLRDDLEVERYRRLGVKERFTNEKPFRICERCIKIVAVPWYQRSKHVKARKEAMRAMRGTK